MKAHHILLALATALPTLADTPATPAPKAPDAQGKASALPAEVQAKADYYFDQYKELATVLQSIEDEASAAAAVPRLHALNDIFEEFLNLPAKERKTYLNYYSAMRKKELLEHFSSYKGAALWLSGTDLLVENEALAYELILRQHPASGFFEDFEMVISQILMTSDDKTDPVLVKLRQEYIADHKAEHDAFLKAHADVYAGGDGSSEQEAIALLPFVQGKADSDADEEMLVETINEYLRAIYPDGEGAFAFVLATPEGGFYHYREIILGLYTGQDGKQHIRTQKVYFQTKQPGMTNDK